MINQSIHLQIRAHQLTVHKWQTLSMNKYKQILNILNRFASVFYYSHVHFLYRFHHFHQYRHHYLHQFFYNLYNHVHCHLCDFYSHLHDLPYQ